MEQVRKQFVEPEIIKHDEKMAELTGVPSIGSPDGTVDDISTQ